MNPEHVVALIAAILQVRNQVAVSAEPSPAKRDALIADLGDPVQEARELLASVVDEGQALPDAPNTKGGRQSVAVGG